MDRSEKFNATFLSLALVVSTITAVTVLGAAVGTVGAIHPSDAPDHSDSANFTVSLPNAEDHYPNREGEGSIEYFASGADAFAEQNAEDGIFVDWIIIHAEYEGEAWIDYSECSTENTKAFGIDRGGDNEGTNYDEDLVTHRKDGDFLDEGLTVEFYDWTDVPEDPPYIAPEDHIVAAQGEGSPGGPCLTMTENPGWYRIAGFINGTVADNGPDQQPSDSAEQIRFQLDSTYVYVCECDSEQEARDELGPPPNEGGDSGPADDGGDDGESTPTATPEPDSTDDDSGTDDGSGDDGSGDDGSGDDGSGDGSSTDDGSEDDGSGDDGSDDGSSTDDSGADDGTGDDGAGATPSADGPGFGALAALVALLASALLLYRRD